MLFYCDIPCSDVFGVGILAMMSISALQNVDELEKTLKEEEGNV